MGDDRDIKVLFSSCQRGPTNMQGVGGDDRDIVLFSSCQGGPTNIQGVDGG